MLKKLILIIFGVAILGGLSFQEGYSQYMGSVEPDDWDNKSENLVKEFVVNTLLQDNSVIKDSIVHKTIHTLEDELPPGIYVKILYAIQSDQEIKHRVLGFEVVFPEIRTPDNAYLEKIFETDYLPPKRITDKLDQYESNYVKNLAKLVVCKEGFAKVIKDADGSPACVKEDSVQKLIERGWAKS